MATRKGIIKKTPIEQFERVASTGIRAITVAEDDELAWVASRPARRHRARHGPGQASRASASRGPADGPRRGRRDRHPPARKGDQVVAWASSSRTRHPRADETGYGKRVRSPSSGASTAAARA
jgi:DNA gyrase/topoisomerase IV subunit A